MHRHKDMKRTQRAQAATELAIFGGIIIFLIGGIVRSAISSSYQQNDQLKAMRLALLKSYEYSIKQQGVGRNAASVLYIEDRLSPDAGKYGTLERVPFIAQGSGTISNLLMYPVDQADLGNPGDMENKNIPMMDVFINGKHFTFSTAALRTGTGTPIFYQISTTAGDYGLLSEDEAFNLARSPTAGIPPVSAELGKVARSSMAWHWKGVDPGTAAAGIDLKNGNYPSYDVDDDLREEILYGVNGTSVTVLDYQAGDVDLTYDTFTSMRNNGGVALVRPGLQNEVNIYTSPTRPDTGYLLIKEGKMYNPEDGAFVRSVSMKDQVAVVRRRFQLSNDTGRMCNGGSPSAQNPSIEQCGDCLSDIAKTCFDPNSKILYVSSRIMDKRGRFWKTSVAGGL